MNYPLTPHLGEIGSILGGLPSTIDHGRLVIDHGRKAMTAQQVDEGHLLDAAIEGDVKAFTAPAKLHNDALRRLVYGMVRDAALTDDVMQEVFVKIYRSLPTFNRKSAFKTWAHRIAYNAVVDELRRVSRTSTVAIVDGVHEPASNANSTADRIATQLDITAALTRLPQRQRAVALLVDGHGYGYGEVATILGIPSGTVGFHLHQARKALRTHLTVSQKDN